MDMLYSIYKRSMNDKRLTLLVFLGTLLVLYFLGYLMNTDILSIVTFHTNGSTFSFIGALLWFIISSIILYVIQVYKNKKG
jgi:hypothetical protein